jgi:hypothetical protein
MQPQKLTIFTRKKLATIPDASARISARVERAWARGALQGKPITLPLYATAKTAAYATSPPEDIPGPLQCSCRLLHLSVLRRAKRKAEKRSF